MERAEYEGVSSSFGKVWELVAFLHRTPRLRGIGSTQPSRISTMRNMETPMGSVDNSSKPIVRTAQRPSGNRMAQKAKADDRKTKEIHNLSDRVIPAPKGG